ncbi:uncharacterized protein [Watersipora subatra]|uniref:uncharacterized protein n=1 Tax=Watersipora subatra TaxID=2589382 RepID=UPI00355B5CFA
MLDCPHCSLRRDCSASSVYVPTYAGTPSTDSEQSRQSTEQAVKKADSIQSKPAMRANYLLSASIIFILIGASLALVVENEGLLNISEEDMAGLQPARKRGSASVRDTPQEELCRECVLEAKTALDRFNQYIYLTYYQGMPNVTNSDQLFGLKTCREFAEVTDCFSSCTAALTAGEVEEVKSKLDYKNLKAFQHLLCEGRYTPGHASCRLADTHRCDKIRRSSCGDTLVEYEECVNEILTWSGQNCTGYCTPARRYLQSQRFAWNMECALKATYKSQCQDIVTIFCFEPIKDTEHNYGVYQDIDTIEGLANNLDNVCQVLESPFECMDTATYGFYDYFGLNVTYACRGAEDTMEAIKAQWQSLIDPFCGANVSAEHNTVEDVCPIPNPANAPPEIPVTPPPTTTTTTERTWDFYEPKSGDCPIPTGEKGECERVCGDDSHCLGVNKCCAGCCKEPRKRTTGRRPRLTTTPKTRSGVTGRSNFARKRKTTETASSVQSDGTNIVSPSLTLVPVLLILIRLR